MLSLALLLSSLVFRSSPSVQRECSLRVECWLDCFPFPLVGGNLIVNRDFLYGS